MDIKVRKERENSVRIEHKCACAKTFKCKVQSAKCKCKVGCMT